MTARSRILVVCALMGLAGCAALLAPDETRYEPDIGDSGRAADVGLGGDGGSPDARSNDAATQGFHCAEIVLARGAADAAMPVFCADFNESPAVVYIHGARNPAPAPVAFSGGVVSFDAGGFQSPRGVTCAAPVGGSAHVVLETMDHPRHLVASLRMKAEPAVWTQGSVPSLVYVHFQSAVGCYVSLDYDTSQPKQTGQLHFNCGSSKVFPLDLPANDQWVPIELELQMAPSPEAGMHAEVRLPNLSPVGGDLGEHYTEGDHMELQVGVGNETLDPLSVTFDDILIDEVP